MTTLRDWLVAGPYTLAMSSGFFGFFAHAGVLSVLEEEGLWPAGICGSSAGALAGAFWASGVSASRMREELTRLRREDFWDVRPGIGLLRGDLLRSRLESLLPVKTFAECRIPLAISAFDVAGLRTTVFRQGDLAPAVHASCALPVMFQPVRIGGRLYLDGGIRDRAGLHGAPAGGRVLFHHLTSRSPWRRKGSPALQLPRRPDTQVVALADLPRLSPFTLQRGPEAIASAARGMRQALARSLG